MIKQLRKRFITLTMGSVVFVLAVLITAINVVNFIGKDKNSAELLTMLSENNGAFPEMGGESAPGNPPEPPRGGRFFLRDDRSLLSAESPFETRFFSVELSPEGVLVKVNTGQIAAVNKSEAVKLAKELAEKGKTSGYSGNYKYLASSLENGDTLYVFLDCTRDLASVRQFLEISILISVIAVIAIFILVVLFSRRAIRPIEESYRKQKEFITNASHELKTPLAVIRSCTDVLSMDEDEKNKKWIDGIEEQVNRLSALVQDLVGLARMDEHMDALEKEDFDLSETAKEILEPFALAAEAKGIGFVSEIEDGISYRGDQKVIGHLFSILADNAVKYTPEGGNISFSLKRSSRHIRLVAENTAEGLTLGKQEHLFERFYRGDTSHSSKKKGYGIGLSMARAIIEAHGGRIEAVSEDGKRLRITAKL